MRCDASGYTYDMNVCAGREESRCDGTVGKCVVSALTATIKDQDVTSAFNRYFTSVFLMDTLSFTAVGTCIKNRKLMPTFQTSLIKSESEFKCSNNYTIRLTLAGHQRGVVA